MKRNNLLIYVFAFVVISILVLSKIFSGDWLLPQSFHFFGLEIHYYGLILAIAIVSSYFLLQKRARQYEISKTEVENITLVILIGGFIGARLYHVLSSLEYYSQDWSQVIMVWNGGLSIIGAVLGGILSMYIYHRYYRFGSFAKLLDWIAPSVVLGQAIGRFGNLVNYEAYGSPTNLPWAMYVPEVFRRVDYTAFNFFHPLFLYESLACLLIVAILLKWPDIAKHFQIRRFEGQIFWVWIGLYSLVRIFTESLRLDSPYIFGFKQNLIVAIIAAVFSLMLLIYHHNNEPKTT